MKKKLIPIFAGCLLLGFTMHSFSASQIINCPHLTSKHYGKNVFYDSKIGRTWSLTWLNRQNPAWNEASIPQTTTCGHGKTANGIPVSYQCAVFKCQSEAVIANLGQKQPVKCFSTYVSTKNTFYCDGFTINKS